jgi:hypothetical protein
MRSNKIPALALFMVCLLSARSLQCDVRTTLSSTSNNERIDTTGMTGKDPGGRPAPSNRLIPDLLSRGSDRLKNIIANPGTYETQILYTQVDRDRQGRPQFRHFAYGVNPISYFNPASLVKLPVACLALQKIHELHIPGLNCHTRLEIGMRHHCQTGVTVDGTAPDGYPTVAHYICKALVASDNDAYNRLYEFLGQEYINASLWRMGYPAARIIRRFNGCDVDDNRYTNPVTFYDGAYGVVYAQPEQVNHARLINPLGTVTKGRAYIDQRGRYVPRPYDYTYDNYISLQDIHAMLQSILFPESFPEPERFYVTRQDYALLYRYLSSLPAESDVPAYRNAKLYPDNYKKYFLFGDAKDGVITDRSIRIFNVVGQSDGYLSDCAYIQNTSLGIEFFLSAVIYVNEDEIMKDGKYEYQTVGLPFLAELGRIIYAYEQTRGHE